MRRLGCTVGACVAIGCAGTLAAWPAAAQEAGGVDIESRIVELADPGTRVLDVIARVRGRAEQREESGSKVNIRLTADVLFAFDSARLSSRAERVLDGVAREVAADATGTVAIEGHTDSKGSDAFNRRLSEKRAQAVEATLARRLEDADLSFDTTGRGEEEPVAPNTKQGGADNPRGRADNRRVEVRFSK